MDEDFVVLPAGRKIGRFEVLSVLGQGSFGITYRARDLDLGRDVAIKEYLPAALAIRTDGTTVRPRSTATAADFIWGRDRFVEEGRIIANLHDAPGIVRVFEFLEANGTAYIVMELVRGETLDARLRQGGPLDAESVERIIAPLLAGLEQVHAAGFLHRDIKPGNILLDAKGNPTLIDFGASRAAMATRTVAMTAIFTPGYAAVEQFTSSRQGPWTDIYGVSATLYHAITGKAPPSAIDRMIDDTCAPLAMLAPAGFTSVLLAGIDAGLGVRAADRPQSIGGWRDMLGGAAPVGAATVAMPRASQSAAAAAAPVLPGWRPLWIGAAVAAALLLVGGGYLAFEPGKSSAPAPASNVAGDRQRIDQEVRRAREQLAAAEQAAERQAAQEARQAAEAEARRKAAADAAEKQRADEDARRQVASQTDQQRQQVEAERQKAEAEAQVHRQAEADDARRKADAEVAERARIQQEVAKAREALAAAEAARQQAEAETARLQAEAETRQKAVAEAAARAQAEAEAAEKQKADADAAAKQKADAEAVARQKADAEAATKQKSDDELRKTGEAAEAALRLSVVDRQRLQVALTALGFDTRGADGAFGPRSREMIAAWQRRQNQPATGYLMAAQQQALLREAAPAVSKYDDEQKKAEEAKRKAEEEAKARAVQQPAAPTTPAAAVPVPQAPAGARDGLWFGAIDCKQSGRQSVQGSVSNGSGRLSGNNLQLTLTISGASASIAVISQHAGGPNGQLSGELRGRSVYAKGLLPRFAGGHDECSVSLVGP